MGTQMNIAAEPTNQGGNVRQAHEHYRKNFLRQSVCELRFPTLMEIGESKAPASFVSALRKKFPIYELINETLIGGNSQSSSTNVHVFRTVNGNQAISLKQHAITIEADKYPGFDVMRDLILQVVSAAIPVIDSEIFTRIGLRYVNLINCQSSPEDGWINPHLIAPIIHSELGYVNDYSSRMVFSDEGGGCHFQHGIKFKPNASDDTPDYLLDIDSYTGSETPINDVARVLDALHERAHKIFEWSIADKTREAMRSK